MMIKMESASGGGGGGTFIDNEELTYNVPKTYNISNGCIVTSIYSGGSLSGSTGALINNGVLEDKTPTSSAVEWSYSSGVLTVLRKRNDITVKMNGYYTD